MAGSQTHFSRPERADACQVRAVGGSRGRGTCGVIAIGRWLRHLKGAPKRADDHRSALPPIAGTRATSCLEQSDSRDVRVLVGADARG